MLDPDLALPETLVIIDDSHPHLGGRLAVISYLPIRGNKVFARVFNAGFDIKKQENVAYCARMLGASLSLLDVNIFRQSPETL